MTWRSCLLFGAVLLCGCDNSPTDGAPGGPLRTDEPANEANAQEQVETGEAGTLPAPGPGPRFIGKWAADMKSCETAAWLFTDTTLRTPAGSSCSFNRITEVPGGYDVQATCSAEAPPRSDTLEIRFAESADAMLFSSKVIADTGLVFCGREV